MSELRQRQRDTGSRTLPVEEGESQPDVERRDRAPTIAVAPRTDGPFFKAIERGGGIPSKSLKGAEGLIWVDPADPKGLGKAIRKADPRWVQLPFAGIENFFGAHVIDRGRIWTCAKGIYGESTAEHALALTLAVARRLHEHALAEGWRYGGFGTPERRLKGATVLIVGTGGIGTALARMLAPLGARVIGVNRGGEPMPGAERTEPVENLPHCLNEADYVVLACALTESTRGLFDRGLLDYMKPEAWLINVARGGLVVTADLIRALRDGTIAGAALDVTDPEPLPIGHPLWEMDNVLITPHVANTWDMALPELSELVRRNVAHLIAGEELEGLVDPELGY